MNAAEEVRQFVEQFPFFADWRFHTSLTIVGGFVGLALYSPIWSLVQALKPVALGVGVGSGAVTSFYILREVEQGSYGDPLNWDKVRDALSPVVVTVLATYIAQLLA